MPHVCLIAAISLDGHIARPDQPGTGFCSPEDQRHFRRALASFDCMVMGRGTYELSRDNLDEKYGRKRLRKVWTRSPDSFRQAQVPDSIEFTDKDPEALLEEFDQRGYEACAVLGGASVYSAFIESNLIDEYCITVEPHIFGGGTPISRSPLPTPLQLIEQKMLNPSTLLLRYRKTP